MAGELWREVVQIGKEASYGVPVAATRKAYLQDVSLTREPAPRPHRFAVGRRDNQLAHTLGPIQCGGSVRMPISSGEMPEWLECCLGAPVISTPSGGTSTRLLTYTMLNTVPSMTLERNDGAKVKRAHGLLVGKITIEGSNEGDNVATFDLFGKDYVDFAALTGSLTDRIPTFIEGWESRLRLDAFGGTPGSTYISSWMHEWRIELEFELFRKYASNNTRSMNQVVLGAMSARANILVDPSHSQIETELDNWDAETYRMLSFEFGQNDQIEGSPTNEVQTLTATGTVSGGTYTISFRGQTTAALAYNASTAVVQAALEALPTIGEGNIQVGGGAFPGTPLTFTFIGQLSGMNVPMLVDDDGSITGGGSIAFAETTPGVGYKRSVIIDLPGAWDAVAMNENYAGTRAYRLGLNYVYDPTNLFGARFRLYDSRTGTFV